MICFSERSSFFDADRPWSTTGLSSFGYPPTTSAFLSASNTPVFSSFTTAFGGVINPRTSAPWFADPRCPQNLNTDPDFPNSDLDALNPGFCNFNYASESATQASLRRDSVMINGNYEVNDDLVAFARVTVSHTESFGRYAPAPNTFFPTVSASNPFNLSNPNHPGFAASDYNDPNLIALTCLPFIANPNFTTNPNLNANLNATVNNPNCNFNGTANVQPQSAGYFGPFDLSMFIRMVPNGPRDSVAQDRMMDILLGLEGYNDWFGGSEWEVGVQHSRLRFDAIGVGYGIQSLLQAAIDCGDAFTGDRTGAVNNGCYDPFAPLSNEEADVSSFPPNKFGAT